MLALLSRSRKRVWAWHPGLNRCYSTGNSRLEGPDLHTRRVVCQAAVGNQGERWQLGSACGLSTPASHTVGP